MTRILFIHNTAMWYRIPFFRALDQIYQIEYLFTHMQVSRDIYGLDDHENIAGMEDINQVILANHLGIAWGLITRAFHRYDVMVGGSWDSIPEILETIYVYTVAWLRRKPIILWREDWAWEDTSSKSKLIQPMIKWMVRISSAIVVPGSKHREYFLQLGSNPEKIFIMPNVSNQTLHEDDHQKSEDLKGKLDLEGKKVILYVGRLIKRKGIQYLLEALSRIHSEDAILLIAGEGECREELEGMVRELELDDKVIFTGNVPQEELNSYYMLSDLVVVPSITYGIGDPWVLVLNEAMYFKNPVIATDAVGAASDMIHDGENGFMVPEKDASALAQSMDKILKDNNLAHKMGEESYKIIQERFRYVNMVNGFEGAVGYSLKKE